MHCPALTFFVIRTLTKESSEMIEFNDNKPIYRQIVDYAFNCIICGLWRPEQRIPSVRELAASMGVNTRTVLKAMDELQDIGVVVPKRGMGFILHAEAADMVRTSRRSEFFNVTLPSILEEMERLEITPNELIEAISQYESTKINNGK